MARKAELSKYKLVATVTNVGLLKNELNMDVHCFNSGPFGGDQQIEALFADQKLDCLIYFWGPIKPCASCPDVKALLRLCSVWNIPVACNVSTADMLLTSPIFINKDYQRDISVL